MNQLEKPKESMIDTAIRSLDEKGYPINPQSFVICIRREYLPSLDELKNTPLHTFPEFTIPFKQFGKWETLVGFIGEIHFFSDGFVVYFTQNLQKSVLKWPHAVLWIPNVGTAGILN